MRGRPRARSSASRALEGGAYWRQAPGDAHQRVAVLGQALAADPPAAGDGGGLVAGRRQAGGRVEVLGGREALDRQRVGRERRGADGRDAGQRREDLAAVCGEQLLEWPSTSAMSACSALPAVEVAASRAARSSASAGGARQPLPTLGPERGGCVGQPARRARLQRPRRRRAAGERRRAGQHRLAGRRLQQQRAAVAGRRRQARAQRVELVMQALLQRRCARRRAGGDDATAPSIASTTCGSAGRPAPWRTSQTSAAQSRSSVLNRRDPSCARAAVVSDGANSRSDPGQRRSSSAAHARCNAPSPRTRTPARPSTPLAAISRSSSSSPSRNIGSDTGSPISPRSPVGHPHPIDRLARIDRDDQGDRRDLSAQQVQQNTPSSKTERKRPSPPPPREGLLKPLFADLSAGERQLPPVARELGADLGEDLEHRRGRASRSCPSASRPR